MEPLLENNLDRFTVFPLKNMETWALYKEAEASFWVPEEIDYAADLDDWTFRLDKEQREYIKYVLAFFAASDGIVNENLAMRFYNDVGLPEAKLFYGMQIAIEGIHSITYSLLIDTYITDLTEKNFLLNAIETIPVVRRKADWALKWISSESSFAERLIGFMCVEGIFFSASFCAIFWLKSKGLMTKGLGVSNEFISRDEGLHCRFAVHLYKQLQNKLSTDKVYEIVKEAIAIEEEFVRSSLPVSMIGINADLMVQYIKYVADFWLKELGLQPLYYAENPFQFMINLSLQNKTNFFESRVSQYQKAHVDNPASSINFSEEVDF